MGLFSSKMKTTVGTSVSRVISNDKDIPNSVVTGTLDAVLNNNGIPESIMDEVISNIGVKAERMYSWAKSEYMYGLPRADFLSTDALTDEVRTYLERMEGAVVGIEYAKYAPDNAYHLAWMKLVSDYAYNPETNELETLSAAKGKQVYLTDMVLVLPTGSTGTFGLDDLEQWGTPASTGFSPARVIGINPVAQHTPPEADASLTAVQARMTYSWVSSEYPSGLPRAVTTESVSIALPVLNQDAEFIQVKYRLADPVRTKYWLYEVGSGSIPELDTLYDGEATQGEFFPFTYFRFDKTDMSENSTSPHFKQSKKMLKYLNMDYASVADAIHENPDIGDVEQAMLMFAVPMNTADQNEIRYLYEFWENVSAESLGTFRSAEAYELVAGMDATNALSGTTYSRDREAITIQDNLFKLGLNYRAIAQTRVPEVIGDIGTHTIERTQETRTMGNDERTYSITEFVFTLKKQISKTICTKITVYDPTTIFHIYGGYTKIGDGDDDILLVPIDRAITKNWPTLVRENLYSRSLHFVFNSRVVTKVKWYQQSWFSAFLMIISIVLLVVYPPAGIVALGAATTATAVLMIVLKMIVQGLLISLALKLFVKAVGVELALVIAVVAAIYGGFKAIQAGSVKGAPWATELLQYSNGLTKAVGSYMNDLIGDLMMEAQAFNLFAEEKMDELAEIQKQLSPSDNRLSPFTIFGESPDEYYNRTIHSGNVGIIALDAIHHYVDVSLRLPTFQDSIRDSSYELAI